MKNILLIITLIYLVKPYQSQGGFQAQIGLSGPIGAFSGETTLPQSRHYSSPFLPFDFLKGSVINSNYYEAYNGFNIGIRYTYIKEGKKLGYYCGVSLFENKFKKSSSTRITTILSYYSNYETQELALPKYYNIPVEIGLHLMNNSNLVTNKLYFNTGLIANAFYQTKLLYKGIKNDTIFFENSLFFPIKVSVGLKIEVGMIIKKQFQIGLALFSLNPIAYYKKNKEDNIPPHMVKEENIPIDLINVHFAYIFKNKD